MKNIFTLLVIVSALGCTKSEASYITDKSTGAGSPGVVSGVDSVEAVSSQPSCIVPPTLPDDMVAEPDIDLNEVEEKLKNGGLGGWIHSAAKDQQLFVFTYRKGNFFVNIQLPFTTLDPDVLMQLPTLRRHDQVVIHGSFIKSKAPLKHIDVTRLEVVKPFSGELAEYKYRPGIFENIMASTEVIGKVHIVTNGGAVLVVEVADRVVPVFNPEPELARNLFRNDKIKLQYKVRKDPTRPAHLELDTTRANPVCLLERMEVGHGQPLTLSGSLVMFPQSPQIIFDVFALRTEDSDGVQRNYTLVNFSDFDVFTAIREKLGKAWAAHKSSAVYDRNKYLNNKIIVTAKGLKNVVDPTQANPQILLSSPDDITFEFK